MQMSQAQYQQVSDIFAKDNVPEYVWRSVMDMESGGNVDSHANPADGSEDSRGLFQINIKAHPEYANVNLYDPVTNAKIADQEFISGTYREAIANGITNPGQQAQYVWRYGIKPNWAKAIKDGKAYEISKEANNIASGNGPNSDLRPGVDPNNLPIATPINNAINGAVSSFNSMTDVFNAIKEHPFNLIVTIGGSILAIFLLYRIATK